MGASRVACASFNIGTNTTITITRDNKAYTHTLKYSFNGATGTIVTKTTATTYVWTPPASTFYSKIPNTTSGYGTITCETYNGNTLIGTTTAGFYAYTVKNACVPTVSGTVVDTNPATIALTGSSSTLVLYLSKPKCTLSATAKNSATIKTIQIENPVGLVATTSPYTFDTVYSKEFRFKATDSRGYSTTTPLNVAKFIEYAPCYFETVPVVTRTESTSTTATTTLKGYCFKGSFGSVSNTLALKYRYKTSNGTYGSYVNVTPTWNTNGTFTANVSIPNLSIEETYTIEFVASDKLTSFPVEVVLGQSSGDFRIAKDYIQAKNNLYLGTENNTEFRAVKARRVLYDKHYEANFGAGNAGGGGSCAIELYENEVQVARYDLHKDGFLYNTLTNMSVAEMMSSAPSTVAGGAQGYMLLNGGDSVNPVLVQWGRVTVTPTQANVLFSQKVNFNFQFSGIPFVSTEKASSAPDSVFANAGDITSSGFTIYLKRPTATATSIMWVAIGNGTNALPE
jgi:hypothetical protein